MQRDFRQYVYAANINVGGLVYSHWREANPALSLSGMWREDCQPDIQLLTHLGAQNQDIKSALTVVRCQPDRLCFEAIGETRRPRLPPRSFCTARRNCSNRLQNPVHWET